MTQLLPIDQYLEQIIDIEKKAHTHPWSENLLKKAEGKFDCHRVFVQNDLVIGYFYSQCVAGEASLLNIAIAPEFQGQGFGKQLLEQYLSEMKLKQASEVWLEVRESNKIAIKLYESIGFNEFDRRYDYYPTAQGREDALIMSYWFE